MKNLVEYSSSSESECEEEKTVEENLPKKKQTLPMLLKRPENSRISDEPENHEMRLRSFGHVEGNWATHVYIDCPLDVELVAAMTAVAQVFADVHLVESPHVSLSKNFILRFHWIESFSQSLRDKVVSPKFHLQLSTDVVYFSNDEKTRHFACILVNEWCCPDLKALTDRVDECLSEFELPGYYENPSWHVSVLWKLTQFTSEEKSLISSNIQKLQDEKHEIFTKFVDKVTCKSGNKFVSEVFL